MTFDCLGDLARFRFVAALFECSLRAPTHNFIRTMRTRLHAIAELIALNGATVACICATLSVLNPSNPKARGELSTDAVNSATVLGTLLNGLMAFTVVRMLCYQSPEVRAPRAVKHDDSTSVIDDSWRDALRQYRPNDLRPPIAWPTVALALVGVGAWLGGAWAGHTRRVPSGLASLICAVGIFLSFTPMHDAVHRALVPKSHVWNDVLGYVSALPFAGVYRVFSFIHLAHHAHLNDPASDPDHWAGSGPLLFLPLRWLTAFNNYHAYAVGRSLDEVRWERVVNLDLGVIMPAFLTVLWWMWDMSAIHYWLLPFLGSTTWLMYVFDYLPHRPHHNTTDPFVATSVITGAPSLIRKDAPSPFLTALLLSQNMHNVHHLMPTVPFYRYGLVWTACADELRRRGTRELPWLLWPSREAHLPELHAESHAKLE